MARNSTFVTCVAVLLMLAGEVHGQSARHSGRSRPSPWSDDGIFVGYRRNQKESLRRQTQHRAHSTHVQPVIRPRERSLVATQVAFQEQVLHEGFATSELPASSESVTRRACRSCLESGGVGHGTPRPQMWGQVEYLLWWTKGMETPALATTSPGGTPQQDAGVLGAAGTSVLFGATGLTDDARSGGRFSLGMWLDPCQFQALELTYTVLEEETDRFSASSADFSILARPFVNAQTGSADARLISFPAVLEGTLSVEANSEFQTAEVLFRRTTRRECGWQLDLLWGYRFADLDDAVRVSDSTLALSGPTAGATLDIFDEFASENQFHGGLFGIHYVGARHRCWSLDLLAKVALGNSRFRGTVSGQTTSTDGIGGTNTVPAGLLALGTNIGTYKEDTFSTIAEFGVTLRRRLQCGVTATFGYTLLGWSDVLRAGEQIDDTLNLTQIPPGTLTGAARPAFPFDTTSFWAQGLNFGLEYYF